MAKRKRKNNAPEMTAEEIEADRLAAHGITVIEMTPENVGEVHNAVAEALGEPGWLPDLLERASQDEDEGNEYTPQDAIEMAKEYEEDEYGPAEKLGELEPEEDPSEDEEKPINSVVAEKFKLKYIENAKALGVPGKAAKRSNWDWLAQQIAKACLSDKDKIRIDDFKQLLDDNGVDHSRWTNRNKGWEGRFRMTGRVALQKKVANAGVLKVGESEVMAPAEFVARYKTKA